MTLPSTRVLVVDDDESFLQVLRFNVAEEGHDVTAVTSGEAALEALRQGPFDLLITDLRMPGLSGEELVAAVHERYPALPILVVTAFADVESAVFVMRHGAADVITKPLQRDLFRHTIRQVLRTRHLEEENAELRREIVSRYSPEGIIATGPAMAGVLETIRRVAPSDATVLLEGESGTGKEILARAIHWLSPRSRHRFVAVNCAAIPSELLESELFGHTKGAFTGATQAREGKFLQANGGTVFLDEVGSLPGPLQAKLLRALQEREIDLVGGKRPVPIDVRILAATNTNLEQLVAAGRFRDDLFYRLNVISIRVPPLRQRPEDILPLMRHFLKEHGAADVQVDSRVTEALTDYRWPGNVRELQNLCQRLALLRASERRITWNDLPRNIQYNRATVPTDSIRIDVGPAGLSLEDAERQILLFGLERMGWNQTRASQFLGISRQTLIYRVNKYGLQPPARPGEDATEPERREANS